MDSRVLGACKGIIRWLKGRCWRNERAPGLLSGVVSACAGASSLHTRWYPTRTNTHLPVSPRSHTLGTAPIGDIASGLSLCGSPCWLQPAVSLAIRWPPAASCGDGAGIAPSVCGKWPPGAPGDRKGTRAVQCERPILADADDRPRLPRASPGVPGGSHGFVTCGEGGDRPVGQRTVLVSKQEVSPCRFHVHFHRRA